MLRLSLVHMVPSPNSEALRPRPKSAGGTPMGMRSSFAALARPQSAGKFGRTTIVGSSQDARPSSASASTRGGTTPAASTAFSKMANMRPTLVSPHAGGRPTLVSPHGGGRRPTSAPGTFATPLASAAMGPSVSSSKRNTDGPRPSSAPNARTSLIQGVPSSRRPASASAATADGTSATEKKRRPDSAPESRTQEKKGPRTVSTGDTTILWNTAAPPNDVSAFLLKKRRQKLTNEELKEIVVTTGDPYQAVMGWFEVFEFYCDPVVDPVLPSMPVGSSHFRGRRNSQISSFQIPESEQNWSDDGVGSKKAEAEPACSSPPKSTNMGSFMARTKFDLRNTVKRWSVEGTVDKDDFMMDLGGGSDEDIWKKLIAKPEPPKLERPRLKQMPRTEKVQAADLDVTSFKRVQSAVNGAGADERILKLCQSRYLDGEDWETLLEARRLAESHSPEPVAPPSNPEKRKETAATEAATAKRNSLLAGFSDMAARTSVIQGHFTHPGSHHEKHAFQGTHLKKDVNKVVHANRLRRQDSHKVVARFEEAVQELPEAVTRHLDFQDRVNAHKDSLVGLLHESEVNAEHFESRQVLLQTSSFALMSSGLLQKAEEGREKKTRPTRAEIQRRRAKILQGIVPLRMSCENLFAVLYRFGITNRMVVERTHRYLKSMLLAKPAKGDGIPFEVFYRFMCALQQPRNKQKQGSASPPRSPSAHPEDALIAHWFDSAMVCNLLFAVIANPPESFLLGSQQLGTRRGFKISVSDVLSSLRLLVCQTLLLECESRRGRSPGSDLNPAQEGHVENEQAGLTAHALYALAECLHQGLTRQGAARNPQKTGSTDEASFHRFMGEFPNVFGCLLRLLLPLVLQGRNFLEEDMELTRKHQDHRTGELQARMNRRIYREQATLLECLWNEFTQPVLQRRKQLNAEHEKNWARTDRFRSMVANVTVMGNMLRKL